MITSSTQVIIPFSQFSFFANAKPSSALEIPAFGSIEYCSATNLPYKPTFVVSSGSEGSAEMIESINVLSLPAEP